MQHLKEFLIRLQTFNLHITQQDVTVQNNSGSAETRRADAYDIMNETAYYDSFSYKSELRVLKDMALIDLLALDKELLRLELEQIIKVARRFNEVWKGWHDNHSEWRQDYTYGYIFTIGLDRLFIVNGLRGSDKGIAISGQFVEDLGDSLKIREKFLKELITDVENRLAPPRPSQAELIDTLKQQVNEATAFNTTAEDSALPSATDFSPTIDHEAAKQIYALLQNYFSPEEHPKLEELLIKGETPQSPLLFRGQANQLADAFKQLYDERLIISRRMIDLENWVAMRFNYLDVQGQSRELSQGYLSGIMSENSRPCKSPILKIERKDNTLFILPVSRGKKQQDIA